MNAQIQVVLIAASCTSAVGLIGMGVIWLLRRAALRLLVQVSGAVVVLAVVAGTLGTARAMFLSSHDLRVVVMVCVVAAVVAAGFGALIGRQLQASSLALREAARSLADRDGGYRSPAGPMTAELAALSRELAETSEKLIQSREREHALEHSRRQLVAWVSHDLRTPLAGLHAMAESLEDGIAADPARYHRQIRAEVARLARMVDDLFELSCAQAGTLRLSPGPIALEDLVNDALASTEALARARGVRLTGMADAPLEVSADPREMTRVLTNLLVNAIRHTPAEGSVHVVAAPEPGGALLAVADSCGGIPEADLACVFDPAWRGRRDGGPGPDGGAGLGLAIVRGIVEAHRGQVSVVNTEAGCRFEVRLPALAGPGADALSPGGSRTLYSRRQILLSTMLSHGRTPSSPWPARGGSYGTATRPCVTCAGPSSPGRAPVARRRLACRPAVRPARARPHGRRPRSRAGGTRSGLTACDVRSQVTGPPWSPKTRSGVRERRQKILASRPWPNSRARAGGGTAMTGHWAWATQYRPTLEKTRRPSVPRRPAPPISTSPGRQARFTSTRPAGPRSTRGWTSGSPGTSPHTATSASRSCCRAISQHARPSSRDEPIGWARSSPGSSQAMTGTSTAWCARAMLSP